MLLTEDYGKQFEKAICNTFGCSYDGKYKYGEEVPNALQGQLKSLSTLCPGVWRHTAKNGAIYDFTNDGNSHLSCKTSKVKSGMVAPQFIGQAIPRTFCERLGIPIVEAPELKIYIQAEILSILPKLYDNTFSCPVIYSNRSKNTIRHITPKSPIPWNTLELTWTKPAHLWANSSSLRANGKAILEIQFHTSRKNMAVRWCFDTLLLMFADNFNITELEPSVNNTNTP